MQIHISHRKTLAIGGAVLSLGCGVMALLAGSHGDAQAALTEAPATASPVVEALGPDARAVALSSQDRASADMIPRNIDTAIAYELPAPGKPETTWRVFVGPNDTCFDFGPGPDGGYSCTPVPAAFVAQAMYLLRVTPTGSRYIQGFAPDGVATVQVTGEEGETLGQSSITHNTFQVAVPDDGEFWVDFKTNDGTPFG